MKHYTKQELARVGAEVLIERLRAEMKALQPFIVTSVDTNGDTPTPKRKHRRKVIAPKRIVRRKVGIKVGSLRARVETVVRESKTAMRPVEVAARLVADGYQFKTEPLHSCVSAMRHNRNLVGKKVGTARSSPIFYTVR